MKNLRFFALPLLLVVIGFSASAQYLKSGYITTGNGGNTFDMSGWSWTTGSAATDLSGVGDDNFFISRVAPKARFSNSATQVNTNLVPWWDWQKDASTAAGNYSKKLVMWTPISYGHSVTTATSPFMAMPNGIFNNEVFSMWQYISHWGLWNGTFMRMPGNFADVAHKNGVAVSTHFASSFAASLSWNDDTWGRAIYKLSDNGSKINSFLEYYGFDGIGYNSEWSGAGITSYAQNVNTIIMNGYQGNKKGFVDKYKGDLKSFAAENVWYDGVTETSGPLFDNGITESTDSLFGSYTSKKTSFFYNYNWNNNGNNGRGKYLENQMDYITKTLGRNPLEIYAGFNLQGKEPHLVSNRNGDACALQHWTYMADKAVSIGLWSGHDTNMFWEARNAKGSKDIQAQDTYQKTIERWFTNSVGGVSNPVYALDNTKTAITNSLDNDINTDFFGMSKMIAAQSSLSWDLSTEPFISYFNLGNGAFFNWEGKRQHDKEWYNIGVQDYLPTWRWWWSRSTLGRTVTDVTTSLTAAFDWNDAWFGGSSLRIKGTDSGTNYLHLFKTKFALKSGDKITVRYKVNRGDANAYLVLGSGSNCATWDGDANDADASGYQIMEQNKVSLATWVEKTITVPNDIAELAVIALRFDNAANLDVNIGEISIKRGSYNKPVAPTITKAELLAFNMHGVDGKVIFTMDKTETKRYNIDHNVLMFKIYAKITYSDDATTTTTTTTTLMGATTSWAGIFFQAPYDVAKLANGGSLQIGVSAVGIDGVSESDITWANAGTLSYSGDSTVAYELSDAIEVSNDFIIDGESFTIKYADPQYPAAKSWKLVGPYVNAELNNTSTITVASNSTSFSATADVDATTVAASALPYGFYNLEIVESDGTTRVLNAFVQVFNPNAGKPKIEKFVALDTDGAGTQISPVSEANAKAITLVEMKEMHNTDVLWADGTNLTETEGADGTLPGAGIKLTRKDVAQNTDWSLDNELTLYYEANSKATGNMSQAAGLNDIALGIKASDLGLTNSAQSFTVAFWIKVTSINAASWLLNVRAPETDTWPQRAWGWLWGDLDKNGYLKKIVIRGSAERIYNYSDLRLEEDAWYHVAYVFNHSNDSFTLYLNGQAITPTSVENESSTWNAFDGKYTIALGGIAGKGSYAGFDGIVDNFQIYNSALNATGVANSMTETPNTASTKDNLVGFWNFEAAAGAYSNGYPNVITSDAYKNAKLIHHYYPTDPADTETQAKVIQSFADERLGYPGFVLGGKLVAVTPEYEVVGAKNYEILTDKYSHTDTEVAGASTHPGTAVTTYATTSADEAIAAVNAGIKGYINVGYQDPGEGKMKVYTVKLTIDNGIGTDEGEYKYIYVTRQTGDLVTGVINTEADGTSVKVFPNPVVENVYVLIDQDGEYEVNLFDMSGRKVAGTVHSANAGECISIDVDAPAGIYAAQVIRDGKLIKTEKLIKK